MPTNGEPGRTVKTTRTSFEIIELLQEHDGARVTEVATALGLAKSTAHNHLSTLASMEYLVKEGDCYYVGTRFLGIAKYVRNRKAAYDLAEPKVEQLAEETGELTQFAIEEHGQAVYLHRAAGERAVRTDTGISQRVSLHTTAAGKAILAHLPAERVDEIVEQRGLPARTEHTITDRDALHEELAAVRDRGYALNREERIVGLRAIGAPVRSADGDVIGSISVAAPSNRMKGEWFDRELPDLLLGIVNELELNITYS